MTIVSSLCITSYTLILFLNNLNILIFLLNVTLTPFAVINSPTFNKHLDIQASIIS